MKNILLLLLHAFLFTQTAFVSGQQATFSKVLYDSLQNGIQTYSIIPAIDSGYMLAGQSTYGGGLILKIDTGGNLLWNKKIGGSNFETFNCIISTNDSNYVIAGSAYNFSGYYNVLVVKINSIGDTIWSRKINHIGYSIVPLAMQQTADSGFIITGYADSLSFGNHGVLVLKLDATGNLQWLKILTGTNSDHCGYSIKQTPDFGFIISGYIENNNPNSLNGCLIKLTPNGNVLWAKEYNLTTGYEIKIFDVVVADSAFLCYAGNYSQFIIMQTDTLGTPLWNNSYYQFNLNQCSNCPSPKLHKTFDNEYVFVTSDCLLSSMAKVDEAGNLLWIKDIQVGASDVLETPDSGLLVGGNGPLCGFFVPVSSPQIGLIKTDSLGNGQACVMTNIPTAITNTIVATPLTFTVLTGGVDSAFYPTITSEVIVHEVGCVPKLGGIHENKTENVIAIYPNPSKGNFTLSATHIIRKGVIEIYNVLGEKIFTENISNQTKKEIKLPHIQPGIYFVKVSDGEKMYSQKLLIE